MTEEYNVDDLINRLAHATDKEEKLRLYKEWADRYDQDVAKKGYVAPDTTAQFLAKHHRNRDARVYDAGCGTGRVGVSLAQLGFSNITGEDFSEPMLDIARLTGQYRSLSVADYTQQIEHADNSFDAAVCVGVYSQEFKHMLIDELVRIVNPGGHIVLSSRPVHFDDGAKPEIDSLLAKGKVSLLSLSKELYIREHNATAWFAVMKVL